MLKQPNPVRFSAFGSYDAELIARVSDVDRERQVVALDPVDLDAMSRWRRTSPNCQRGRGSEPKQIPARLLPVSEFVLRVGHLNRGDVSHRRSLELRFAPKRHFTKRIGRQQPT